MPGLIAALGSSDWSYGGSILTFLFPMILFIAVAGGLYVLYTKPHIVPGHHYLAAGRSVTATHTPSPGGEGQDGRSEQAASRNEGGETLGRHGPGDRGTEAGR